MAGENILVEFDYNNISIIDPNKVVDLNGKVKERYIKQEDLVIYANLECTVLPRTKLAIGGATTDNSRTVRLASINFLNPGKKNLLDNSYTDELTGKNTLNGLGVNQFKKTAHKNPNRSDDYYITQQVMSNGQFSSSDNGMLGITNISIKQNSSFLTQISVTLEDIKGRTLFESGDESPYAVFFNLPYPLFYLTIKGFLGKAIRLALMLVKFNGRYDSISGNFKIQLDFMTYKYTILSEISMGALLAVPHMYTNVFTTPKQTTNGSTTELQETITTKGFEKIKELYSEYKNKGLIPDDFPELTLLELKYKIDVFLKTILDNFEKQDMSPLTDIRTYSKELENYRGEVYTITSAPASWFNRNLDTFNFFVINRDNKKIKVYKIKEELKAKEVELVSELDGLITKFNESLANNKTFGTNGGYTIKGGESKKTTISNSISLKTFNIKVEASDIDVNATIAQRRGTTANTFDEVSKTLTLEGFFNNTKIKLKNGETELISNFYIFEGEGSFTDKIDKMKKNLKIFKEQIENDLTLALAEILRSPTSGLGFNPTIRNVLAVIFANGEAFLRLLDDVHTAANNLQSNKERRDVIFNRNDIGLTTNVPNVPITDKTPIYPWPQIINITNVDGKEKYEIKYPGADELIAITKADNFELWPEVEFVEEFIKGYVQRESSPANRISLNDLAREPSRISYNAIEFPIKNNLFSNKEQTKFFYEIYERVLLNTYYSRLSRSNVNNLISAIITNAVGESESENIILGLGDDSPLLNNLIKNEIINSSNILDYLFQFSNNGLGESWNNFQFGIFNTKYIKNYTENAQFQFLNIDLFNKTESQPQLSLEKEKDIKEYVIGSTSNVLDVTDTYPFTDLNWCKSFLAKGGSIADVRNNMSTNGVLNYNNTYKVITNFTDVESTSTNRPVTYFLNSDQPNVNSLNSFYASRYTDYKNQLITEGNVFYLNYDGRVGPNQTTSIFNTPYFINAIQDGVDKYVNNSPYPYVSAAYLFLNSLPLGTLKEKLKSLENGETIDKTYLYASLKKFSAIHKLPYAWVLKYGAIWHRYKTYIGGGSTNSSDILTPVWKNFDAVKNFDPVTNSNQNVYNLTINNQNYPIVFQSGLTLNNINTTIMNLGFYPKTVNDFSTFYLGGNIIKQDSQIIGIGSINGSVLTVTQINGTLDVGYTIIGNNIPQPTVIISVITQNTFEVFPQQQAIADFFFVTNANNPGYSNNDIQEAILSGLTFIPEQINFSAGTSFYNITKWSSYIKTQGGNFAYIMPSYGTDLNQFKDECTENTTLFIDITGNTAVYNGSVRTYWSAPNYGYFDNELIAKPSPFQYMKNINNSGDIENYSINGISEIYSDIDELFSVFNKDTLDLFEQKFLNFSKSIYDFEDENVNSDTQVSIGNLQNFQSLMRDMMLVPLINDGITEIQNQQFKKINNILNSFLNYDLIVKIGNPSNFERRLFYTFSNLVFENPYTWRKYSLFTPNVLPSSSGSINLVTSQNLYPLPWRALYTYVGFSNINELAYKDTGSFITDFFIDLNVEFNVENIKTFAPIIKIYATQKINQPQSNGGELLKESIGLFLEQSESYLSKIIDNIFTTLRKKLSKITIASDNKKISNLDGPQTKDELWETFKAINDKWISGQDITSRTLFEDILILDRANRNIGDKFLIDIFGFNDRLTNIPEKSNMLLYVMSILRENNFQVLNIPGYINFYNVQDVVKNPIPKPEGTLEIGNTLFGVFNNVDYTNSSTKMVCQYAGKPSEHLAINSIDYRYRNDSFELNRVSDNPLIENQIGKNDWDKSNKVVGFNVDIGPQNQSIIKSFSVSQNGGLATMESLRILNDMANQAGNRSNSTQSVSLYNLYKNRSYTCNLSMMGNAMIQPTMYFNLRYVPMFSGPYMITEVNHTISVGDFSTDIVGIRQPTASLPTVDNFLQSLKQNLLVKIDEKIKKDNEPPKKDANGNVIEQKDEVIKTALGDISIPKTQTCKTTIDRYKNYSKITPTRNKTTFSAAKQQIKNLIITTGGITDNNQILQKTIFTAMYLWSGYESGFEAFENNYSGVLLQDDWQNLAKAYFSEQYFCVKIGEQAEIPYAVFRNLTLHINTLINRWKQQVFLDIPNDNNFETSLTKFLILNRGYYISKPENVYTTMSDTDKNNIKEKVIKGIKIFEQAN